MGIRIKYRVIKRCFFAAAIVALMSAVFWQFTKINSYAADIRNFDPGNIMSDAVMSNKDTMSVQQIQSFLDSKNYCDNRNTHMAAWYPHLQYSIKDGKFVCMAREDFNGKSAAQLIWNASQEFNINPQVLIVLLEKEQGLVSDTWPNHVQYRTATGFGCPDTAPCDSQYYGLENQLRLAAKLFREVLNGGWSNYPVGQRYVQYHPNAACGGSIVNIQNRATSALYRYTPYQPNQSALDAGYGTGDACGAYGNRNTWRLFTDWFGNPISNGMVNLEDPRWMQIANDTQKRHASTEERFGPVLVKGRQIEFKDKVYVNGRWLLRTAYDQRHGNYHGIPLGDLEEIKHTPLADGPKLLVTTDETFKQDPIRNKRLESIGPMVAINMADKITLNGVTYIRTVYEKNLGMNGSIKESDLAKFQLFSLIKPRSLVAKDSVRPRDIITGEYGDEIRKNSILYFGKRISMGGALYVQPDILQGTNMMLRYDSLVETRGNVIFSPMVIPRWMKLTRDTQKRHAETNEMFGPTLPKDRRIQFIDKIYVNGEWLLRTAYDKRHGNLDGIPLSDLGEI